MEGLNFFQKTEKKEGTAGGNKLLMKAILAAVLSFAPAKAQELGLSQRDKDSIRITNEVGKFFDDKDSIQHSLPNYYSAIKSAEEFEKGSTDEKADLIWKKDSTYTPKKIGIRGDFEYKKLGSSDDSKTFNLEKLDEYAETMYPKGFAHRNVDSVVATDSAYHDSTVNGFSSAGYFRKEKTIGTFKVLVNGEKNYEKAAEQFWRTMDHELAHSEDWTLQNGTSFKERIHLLRRILDRVKSSNRYKSEYVESIKYENKETELYRKCTEYWAEIFQVYMSGNDTISASDKAVSLSAQFGIDLLAYNKEKRLPQEDKEIVEDYIRATDPDFDLARSRAIRAEAIKAVMVPVKEIKKFQHKKRN